MLTSIGLMKLLCEQTGKYAVFYSGWCDYEPDISEYQEVWDEYLKERDKALIFLDKDDKNYWQIIIDGYGFSIFDNEKDMENFYNKIVGDDGPTELNPYNGPIKVYALTCGPNGLLNENT